MNQVRALLTLIVTSSILVFASSVSYAEVSADATVVPPVRHRHHSHRLPKGLDEPALRSSAALVLDETDSSVLYSKHSDIAMPIASITKLMTAIVVTEAGQPMDEILEITADDRSTNGKGAYSRLIPGTKLSRDDLLHLALMSSENRAAHALGRNYPGGLTAFVQAMNDKATALGMSASRFVDPTGLDSDNVASPEDLSKLVKAAAENPMIRQYSTDKSHTVRVGRRLLAFRNTDSLVSNPGWNIVVQKTGYISEAGRCLVMQAVIEDRPVVIVLLNSYGKNTRVADARRIRKWMEPKLIARGTPAVTSGT